MERSNTAVGLRGPLSSPHTRARTHTHTHTHTHAPRRQSCSFQTQTRRQVRVDPGSPPVSWVPRQLYIYIYITFARAPRPTHPPAPGHVWPPATAGPPGPFKAQTWGATRMAGPRPVTERERERKESERASERASERERERETHGRAARSLRPPTDPSPAALRLSASGREAALGRRHCRPPPPWL